jgi:hypothetical protein
MESESSDGVVIEGDSFEMRTLKIKDSKGNSIAETSYTTDLMAVDMHTHPSMHAYMSTASF